MVNENEVNMGKGNVTTRKILLEVSVIVLVETLPHNLNLIRKGFSFVVIFIVGIVFIYSNNFVSAGAVFYDQGTNASYNNGTVLGSGDLTILIYDVSIGGSPIFDQTYINGITSGSWNVKINPDLEFNRVYYKDYKINGDNINFSGVDRIEFQSSLGMINDASFINFSLIDSCATGSSIRQVYSNGSVVCEITNGSSEGISGGWINDSTTTNTSLDVKVGGNISTENYGFFGWLGSLVNRITKLFVEDIDASGNITASYFIGNGSQLSGIIADNLSENATLLGNVIVTENLNISRNIYVGNNLTFGDNQAQIYLKGGELIIKY